VTAPASAPEPIGVDRGGFALQGSDSGDGPLVLVLHGLTATRRYVFHGSRTLERSGHRVIAYDARGHGESDPAPESGDYRYAEYADDAVAVLDTAGVDRAVLVGHSMGAATAVRVALLHPERVAGLVLGAPAHLGRPSRDLGRWDALAHGLETGGPAGMLAALEPITVPDEWADSLRTVILQRLSRHRHPQAVADALRATPRSAAFDGLGALGGVAAPTLVVGSRDEIDPDHPLAVAREYATRIPGADFAVEEPGAAPITWRGGVLSQCVLDFLDARGIG
jgi:pimeloyl-ACP methyl ester carboxylesterase